jgi:hypothetical protein
LVERDLAKVEVAGSKPVSRSSTKPSKNGRQASRGTATRPSCLARLIISSLEAPRADFRFLKRTPARMPGSERRRGGSFVICEAGFGWSHPVVCLDDLLPEGGQSPTRGIRHGRPVHASTIPIEVAEIGRGHPTLKRLLYARPGLRVDGVAVRAGHSASLDSSAIVHAVTIHIEEAEIGRSIRPPRARCAPAMRPLALPGTPATPKAIPGRLITLGIGEEAAATARLHLRVHAPAIHIEAPEIGRLDPPPKALVHP